MSSWASEACCGGFGLKVGKASAGQFAARIRKLAAGQPMLEQVTEAMLRARETLRTEVSTLHRKVLEIVRADKVCRLLMTVPGVGALTALTFKPAVDDPARFTSSKAVGPHFGLTPKKSNPARPTSPALSPRLVTPWCAAPSTRRPR